jgi:hypothetical protein
MKGGRFPSESFIKAYYGTKAFIKHSTQYRKSEILSPISHSVHFVTSHPQEHKVRENIESLGYYTRVRLAFVSPPSYVIYNGNFDSSSSFITDRPENLLLLLLLLLCRPLQTIVPTADVGFSFTTQTPNVCK